MADGTMVQQQSGAPPAPRVAFVNIGAMPWPMSVFGGLLQIAHYRRSRTAIDLAVREYARTLGEEVSVVSNRSPVWGRLSLYGGHVLGWSGLVLAVAGLLTQIRPDHYELLFGAFGVGIILVLAGAALVRHGREVLTPTAADIRAVDRRRPVLLLASFRNSDKEIVADAEAQGEARPTAVADTMGLAFRRFGPFEALPRPAAAGTSSGGFGEVRLESVAARQMDGAVLLIAAPAAGAALATEIDAIVRRRHAHKLIVLMPPLDGIWPWDGTPEDANDDELRRRRTEIEETLDWKPKAKAGAAWDRTKRRVRSLSESEEELRTHRWAEMRTALQAIPGFAALPAEAPKGVIAVHLDAKGAPVIVTGPKVPKGADYASAINVAVYGMKCHGKW